MKKIKEAVRKMASIVAGIIVGSVLFPCMGLATCIMFIPVLFCAIIDSILYPWRKTFEATQSAKHLSLIYWSKAIWEYVDEGDKEHLQKLKREKRIGSIYK